MKYTGRVLSVLVMLLGIVIIRMYASDHSFAALILPSGLTLILAFLLGKQYDKIKFYSERDSLTGLYNRRFAISVFPKMLSSVDSKNQKLSILLLDCDKFKVINDTYGHTQGDQVLAEVAALLMMKIKHGDVAVRWGGDEFLLIAPNTDEAKVKIIIDRLNKELGMVSEKLQIDISVSSGFAVYPTEAQTLEELIQAADTKLYIVKNSEHQKDIST